MYNKLFGLIYLLIFIGSGCNYSAEMDNTQYDQYPVYEGTDLGVTYTSQQTSWRLWSPPATDVRLRLYEEGIGGQALKQIDLERDLKGTWQGALEGDWEGYFYTFQVRIGGKWLREAPDPYAPAVGVNGRRGMVVDLDTTDPEGWENDRRPPLAQPTDIVIYELHIRDLSTHPSSGIQHRGKFLGLTETGAQNPQGLSTGLDHIKELGVTHIHLLPVFDFRSIDETRLQEAQFNWGYDPQNYNTPEGSYATDPYDGRVRIREFKQLVKSLHDNGLRVIMDVVYNHTGATQNSLFNQLVPGYYYRQDSLGRFSDASACGNETASERPMMRKFMVESLLYWAKEYHIDGFRFDLMGIHDIGTMNEIARQLHQLDSTIFLYGEGWAAGPSPLPEYQRALKRYTYHLDGIAAFSDDIRDGVKGHVFTPSGRGFASGKTGTKESIKFGLVGATDHPQIDYSKVNYSDKPWAEHPCQSINYASAHDNHTLWDRLALSVPDASEAERIRMHLLANAIVLTAQGVPFLHAGVEMLRTKEGEENSFESPDSINQLDWNRKSTYREVFEFHRALIQLRKKHPAFRMMRQSQVAEQLEFLPTEEPNLLAFLLKNHANGDSWGNILVVFNGKREPEKMELPLEGPWTVVLEGEQVNEGGLYLYRRPELEIPASSAVILHQ